MSEQPIIALVAYQKDRGIGKANTLPWHVPSDLAHFKTLTQGSVVVMGRNTWESLPVKPLSKRLNIVISSTELNENAKQLIRVRSLEEAIQVAQPYFKPIYLIGGAAIYSSYLRYCTDIIATEFTENLVEDPDCYFPQITKVNWRVLNSKHCQHHGEPQYYITHYQRKD